VGADPSIADKCSCGVGFLTATASDDWTLVLELCERASISESTAKGAANSLRQELKCVDSEFIN